MKNPLIASSIVDDEKPLVPPPSNLYVTDSTAKFPLILELDSESDKAAEYDLCMVFNVEKGTSQLPQHALNFCRKMIDNGLDIFLFYGIEKKQIFVLIRASFDVSSL